MDDRNDALQKSLVRYKTLSMFAIIYAVAFTAIWIQGLRNNREMADTMRSYSSIAEEYEHMNNDLIYESIKADESIKAEETSVTSTSPVPYDAYGILSYTVGSIYEREAGDYENLPDERVLLEDALAMHKGLLPMVIPVTVHNDTYKSYKIYASAICYDDTGKVFLEKSSAEYFCPGRADTLVNIHAPMADGYGMVIYIIGEVRFK